MYCNLCFWDTRPKNNLLISNFTIFESLLFEGYSCKRLQTLYTYKGGLFSDLVHFLIWALFNTRPQSSHQLRNG